MFWCNHQLWICNIIKNKISNNESVSKPIIQLRDKFQTFDTAYSLATCIKEYLQCVVKPYKIHIVFLCDEI